jgi:hypothetical protein
LDQNASLDAVGDLAQDIITWNADQSRTGLLAAGLYLAWKGLSWWDKVTIVVHDVVKAVGDWATTGESRNKELEMERRRTEQVQEIGRKTGESEERVKKNEQEDPER